MGSDLTGKSRRLAKGDTVHLEREHGDWMKGAVVGVDADGIDVVVDGPIEEGEVLSVSRTVRDDARYTAVMEVVDAGPGRSRVRLAGEWQRVQMRSFVRVNVQGVRLDVRSERPERAGEPGPASEERLPRLLDVSVGGLRFESAVRHRKGDAVEISFHLPQTGPVTVCGEVVRAVEGRGAATSQYAVRFSGLEETTRVKLMAWVVTEQARRFRESRGEACEA